MTRTTRSVSVTDSSESGSVSASRLATPNTEASLAASLTNGLDNVHLSSPLPTPSFTDPDGLDMSALAAAVESVEQGADEQDPLPESPPVSPRALRPPDTSQSRPSSRRRSNGRASDRAVSYNVDDEDLPPHRLYSPEVQSALRNGKSLMESLSAALGSSASGIHKDKGSTIHGLHKQAAALANFQLPPSWTVGFVGGTGAGKSSLLNSLLHRKNLTTERSSGRACTSVATEFRYRAGDHFTIEIELFGGDKLVEQLADLVRTYRSYHVPEQMPRASDTSRDASHTNKGSAGAEKESRKSAEEDAKEALSMLWTLFGKQTDEYMQLLLEDDEDHILAVLTGSLLDNRRALAADQEVFTTAEACSHRLMELTVDSRRDENERPPDEPVKWPYIRAIKVYLDSRILSKGLVLVDLPGLGDRNAAREAVTESYLVRCNEVFVVNHIGRVVSSSGVERVIDLSRQAKLDNVGIICTHAEDFGTERIEITRGPRASQVRQLLQRIQRLQQEIHDLEDDLSDSEDECGFSSGEISRAALQNKFDLQSAIRRKERERRICEFNVLRLRIEDRNETVERQIKSAYRDKLPRGIQNVFCVGNVQYWEFWERGNCAQEVHLSGIPRFRRHCLAKVADSQLMLVAKYIRDSIPALLGEVELWAESGAGGPQTEQEKAVLKALGRVEGELATKLTGRNTITATMSKSSMQETFDKKIYRNRHHNRPVEWAKSALMTAREWSCWSAHTYIAFCRHHGAHMTAKSGGWHSWNEEAMKAMVDDLKQPWSEVCLTLRDDHYKSLSQIENLIDGEVAQLEMETLAPSALLRTIRTRNSVLASDIHDCLDTFQSDLYTLGINALSGIRTGLFGTAMEDTYNTARLIHGTGCTVLKQQTMNRTLGDPDLFVGVMRAFRDKFIKHALSMEQGVDDAIANYLNALGTTFDIVRSENAASESEADRPFTDRVSASVAAAKTDLESLQSVFPQR